MSSYGSDLKFYFEATLENERERITTIIQSANINKLKAQMQGI